MKTLDLTIILPCGSKREENIESYPTGNNIEQKPSMANEGNQQNSRLIKVK